MSLVSEVQVEEEPELEEEKKGFWGKVLDVTQTGLDVAGMIPVIGEVADLANAGIYAARGDYTNAALSAAAAIPFVGWAATGAKFAVKGSKLLSKAGKVIDNVMGVANKVMDKAGQVAKAMGDLAKKAGDTISGALGKVMTKAKGLASNFSPMDLANKLKSKLNDLMMKSPKLANGLKTAGGMATGFMQNLLISEAMNYGLEQLSQYVDSDTITKAMILLSMLNSKYKKNQNQGITSNNKNSGDKDKSKKDKDTGNKDKDVPKDKTKEKDKTKDDPNKPKPKDQEADKSKGKTGDDSKDSSTSDTKKEQNVPEGYYQDTSGRWHRPGGGYASNKEVGLPEPSGLTKRLEYMGDTPGKSSRTGKEVIERMKKEDPPKIRTTRDGDMEFMASDEKWYPIDQADMAHLTDAVSWWNSKGKYYGAKSPEVREWMLDSDNYVLDHYSLNRSAGAKLNETYLPPDK
ncbi:GH-E family nuclease [Paenibacillus sp. AD87]|uniref:GH-E family nuclease n=1 Tax=Paenibacillus sp. AD87 TaxID=1528787 RepID=UPI001E5C0074|nr:GH-E family nuclease [Paenibacillus sp. AD87]